MLRYSLPLPHVMNSLLTVNVDYFDKMDPDVKRCCLTFVVITQYKQCKLHNLTDLADIVDKLAFEINVLY